MTVDRGGLQYGIVVEDQFSTNIDAFRARVREAREEWKALKAELASSRTSSRRDPTARQMREVATETRKATQALKTFEEAFTRDRLAMEAWNRELRNQALARAEARVAVQKDLRLQRTQLTQDQARVAAERRLTKTIDQRAVAEQAAQAVRERGIQLSDAEIKSLGRVLVEEERLRKAREAAAAAQERVAVAQQRANEAASLARQKALREDITRRLERQVELEEQINAARVRQAATSRVLDETDEQRIRRLRENLQQRAAAGEAFAPRGLSARLSSLSATITDLDRRIGGADNKANRAAFTFRRLFGILAAFTAARIAIRGFRELSTSLVTLNGEAERIEVGITGVIAAVGNIRNASGEAVSGLAAFEVAGEEARRQIRLLRIDALSTTATFEELSDAFQTAIGPGLAAGLDLDQIRTVSRQISQAASAIGLSQNQLAEEIRSILSGTIRLTQTRIAAVLNITNEDIRNAREAGELFEFLQERLADFDEAGRRAARTLPGLQQRLKDAFEFVLREGGFSLFEDVKDLLEATLDDLVEVDEVLGTVSVDPDAVEFVSEIAEGLRVAVAEGRRFIRTISNDQALSLAQGLRDIIAGIAILFSGIAEGAVIGLSAVERGLRSIANLVRNITGVDLFDAETFQAIVVAVAAVATISFSIQLAWQAVSVALGGVRLAASAVLSSFSLMARTLAMMAPAAQRLAVAIGLANVNSKALLLTLGKTAALLIAAAAAFTALAAATDSQAKSTRRAAAVLSRIAALTEQAFTLKLGTKKGRQELADLEAAIKSSIEGGLTFSQSVENQIDIVFGSISRRIGKLFSDMEGDADSVADGFAGAGDRVADEVAGFVLGASQALDELDEKLKQFREESDDSLFDTEATFAGLGLTGTLLEQVRARVEATRRAFSETNRIRNESLAIERQIASLQDRVNFDESLDKDQRGRLLVRLSLLQEELVRFKQAELEIENALQRISSTRVANAAVEANFQQARESALLRIAAARDAEATAALRVRDFGRADLADAKARVLLLTEEARQAEQIRAIEAQRLDDLIALAQEQRDRIQQEIATQGESVLLGRQLQEADREINELLVQRSLLQQRNLLLSQQEAAAIEQMQIEAQRLKDIQDQPVRFGFIEAAEQFDLDTAAEKFFAFRDIATNIIAGLSETISSTLVDAFDPFSDGTIEERFSAFIKSIAQQIIQTFVQVAIAKAVLGLGEGPFGAFFNFNKGGEVPSFHRGGSVHERQRRRVASHRRARGYSLGGSISPLPGRPARPRGVHPKDTVPAWLQPKEWVIRARSAAMYGDRVLRAINEGLIDPSALQALAGVNEARQAPVRAARGPGFAAGGRVPEPRESRRAPQQGAPSGPTIAVIAPDEEAFRRLLAGGKNAMLEFLGSSEAKGAMGL